MVTAAVSSDSAEGEDDRFLLWRAGPRSFIYDRANCYRVVLSSQDMGQSDLWRRCRQIFVSFSRCSIK